MRKVLLGAALAALSFTVSAQGYGPGPGAGYGPRGGGPGMMQGYGPGYGMGRGGMHGPGFGAGPEAFLQRLDAVGLTDEQRSKVDAIQSEVRRKHWDLMGQMRELRFKSRDPVAITDAEALKDFDAMTALRRQMLTSMLDARKRIEEVLTAEQREKLRASRPPRG